MKAFHLKRAAAKVGKSWKVANRFCFLYFSPKYCQFLWTAQWTMWTAQLQVLTLSCNIAAERTPPNVLTFLFIVFLKHAVKLRMLADHQALATMDACSPRHAILPSMRCREIFIVGKNCAYVVPLQKALEILVEVHHVKSCDICQIPEQSWVHYEMLLWIWKVEFQ